MTRNGGKPVATSGTVIPATPVIVQSNFSPDRLGIRLDFGSYVLSGHRTEQGWVLEAEASAADRERRQTRGCRSGFRYCRGERTEAWVFRDEADRVGVDGWSVMLVNGRLFRSVQKGLRNPTVELVDWESGAPYWIAAPQSDGWSLRPTAAGSGLEDKEFLLAPWALAIVNADLSPMAISIRSPQGDS